MRGVTSIRARLRASYLVLLALLVLVVVLSVSRFQLLSGNIRSIVDENAALVELTGELNVNAESLASRLLLLFVLEERDARVAIYKEIDERNRNLDSSLEKMALLVHTPKDKGSIEGLKKQRKVYQEALQATVEALEFGELEEAKKLMAGTTRNELQTFLKQTSALSEYQRDLMQQRQQKVLSESELAIWLTVGVGLLAVLIGLVMSVLISRSIVNPLNYVIALLDKFAHGDLSQNITSEQKGEIGQLLESVKRMQISLADVVMKIDRSAKTVVSAVEEIRTNVADVNHGSNAQAVMASDIQGSVSELSNAANVMADHVSVSRNQAEDAHGLAKHGKKVITSAATDITAVAAYIEETSQAVAELNQSAMTVTEFVNSIRNVAEQTNLLALNASIEAARAGESGRGFAVVADEVRNLATNTAEVTASIDKVITTISSLSMQISNEMVQGQEKMRHGVAQIEDVVAPLSQLEADAAKSLESLDDLSQLAQQQAREANDIAEHVTRIVEVTVSNEQTSKRLSKLTDALSGAAEQTDEATSTFILPAK
ncbi:methyl-accepting chemotaxis protein [Marinomonas rhizomae]|uniref:Methyl-accepting chemotaxis protein n=1 Tax=Marinomonas rhizomae TaxID=491948 RepID=A0A366JD48_9GAMM|nr:methyl-accepting chemotaxis protein [Marinomonas rhizomae]RBP83848.1 methyl-accepting chemotaxis protein [Marinomonas rhizomae]RNF73446.1 methyl-accepting chemotaxis protein [Marinomonas rhizomae]